MKNYLAKYIELIESFINKKLDALEFESQYLAMFKNESESLAEVDYNALDALFSAVDAFCPDPDLRDEYDIDENQLAEEAKDCLSKLKN